MGREHVRRVEVEARARGVELLELHEPVALVPEEENRTLFLAFGLG